MNWLMFLIRVCNSYRFDEQLFKVSDTYSCKLIQLQVGNLFNVRAQHVCNCLIWHKSLMFLCLDVKPHEMHLRLIEWRINDDSLRELKCKLRSRLSFVAFWNSTNERCLTQYCMHIYYSVWLVRAIIKRWILPFDPSFWCDYK